MLKHKEKLKRYPPMARLRKMCEEPVEAQGLSSKCFTATSWHIYVTNMKGRGKLKPNAI